MVGDILKVNEVDLLVIDEINGNPFVIALDLGIESKFSEDSTDYRSSLLKLKVDNWFKSTKIKAIPRILDLTTMDGYTGYGSIEVDAAPLTFDEWRKYARVIKPHIKNWFWLVTSWGDPSDDYGDPYSVCYVFNNGTADYNAYNAYNSGIGVAPAFVLDKNNIDVNGIERFSTEELLAEIARRMK